MEFLEALHAGIVPGDGAMGTLLWARGVPREACLEELCASNPERVREIHREYLAAGAQVIRTHSFGANAVRLAAHGFERRVAELNWLAANIAREAVKGSQALVAASIGPTGEGANARPHLEEQMGALLDGGAQLVILETFLDLSELLVAVEVKHSLHHCPVVASVACGDPSQVAEAFEQLRNAGADLVGVNCVGGPERTRNILPPLDPDQPVAAFPSAGTPSVAENMLTYPIDPDAFASGVAELVGKGVRFVGGCCGTTPLHIAAMIAQLVPGNSLLAR